MSAGRSSQTGHSQPCARRGRPATYRVSASIRPILSEESAAKLPDSPQVQYRLGTTYAQVGDKDNVRKPLTAATSGPADVFGKTDAKKTLAALKQDTPGIRV